MDKTKCDFSASDFYFAQTESISFINRAIFNKSVKIYPPIFPDGIFIQPNNDPIGYGLAAAEWSPRRVI
jgi:hypothetical protein